MQLSSLNPSMCPAISNTNQPARFQYATILTQLVYMSGNLKHQSTCGVSVCSYNHASMCPAISNTNQPLRFQYAAILASLCVYQSNYGVSVCSYPHSMRLYVRQSQPTVNL
ncbi:unnamed protein product [Ectocarpus sp. 4 AP-2014]